MRRAAAVILVLLLAAPGCAGAAEETTTVAPSTSTTAPTLTSSTTTSTAVPGGVPTPEELAAWLLTAEDLGGAWSAATELLPPGMSGGVVTDEAREQLPGLGVCPEAGPDAAAAAAAVAWLAFGYLQTPGAERPVFLGQGLFAGDPEQIEAVFNTLKEAMAVCAGVEQVPGDGPTQVTEPLPIPEVGDDRFGVKVTMTDGDFHDYLWYAFVRDGAVFMLLNLWEGTATDTVITGAQVDAIITTAAGRLP